MKLTGIFVFIILFMYTGAKTVTKGGLIIECVDSNMKLRPKSATFTINVKDHTDCAIKEDPGVTTLTGCIDKPILVDVSQPIHGTPITKEQYIVNCRHNEGYADAEGVLPTFIAPTPINVDDIKPFEMKFYDKVTTKEITTTVELGTEIELKIFQTNPVIGTTFVPKTCTAHPIGTHPESMKIEMITATSKACPVHDVLKLMGPFTFDKSQASKPTLKTNLTVFEFTQDDSHTLEIECKLHVCLTAASGNCDLPSPASCPKNRRRRDAVINTGAGHRITKSVKGTLRIQSSMYNEGLPSAAGRVGVSWFSLPLLFVAWFIYV